MINKSGLDLRSKVCNTNSQVIYIQVGGNWSYECRQERKDKKHRMENEALGWSPGLLLVMYRKGGLHGTQTDPQQEKHSSSVSKTSNGRECFKESVSTPRMQLQDQKRWELKRKSLSFSDHDNIYSTEVGWAICGRSETRTVGFLCFASNERKACFKTRWERSRRSSLGNWFNSPQFFSVESNQSPQPTQDQASDSHWKVKRQSTGSKDFQARISRNP